MNMEDLCIKKIEGGIRGIRLGNKNPTDVRVGLFLDKLKKLNEGMYEDYLEKYKNVMKLHEQKNN
jgi:hypothetical protein